MSRPFPITEWIQKYFYIPELNGPMVLFPHQVRALEEALSVDEKGRYKYNLVLWSDIKKSAKSCIAAARALYQAYQRKWSSVKIVANDLKQADSRVAYYLRRAIELSPQMEVHQVRYLTEFSNHSRIEAIPIDPGGEAGGTDDLIIFSELWAASTDKIQKMWNEMTISPTKFGYSQRWVETYAGHSGQSPLLEKLYEDLVKEEYRIDPELELYAHDGMLALWNTIPRLPWQTPEYYASEMAALSSPQEFNRIHRNQWSKPTEKFVERIWWENCQETLPPLSKDEPMIIAMDANKGSHTTNPADCFSIVGVTRHPVERNKVAVRYCGIWEAPQGQLMDYTEPLNEIKRLCKEFSIIEISYDPYQLHWAVSQFQKEGVGFFKEFSQATARLHADKGLRQMIIAREIIHDGNALLAQHIDNSNVQNKGEDGVRLIKRNNKLKIDAAVALSMAVDRCLYYNLE